MKVMFPAKKMWKKMMLLNFGRYGLYLSCDECKETLKIPVESFGVTIKKTSCILKIFLEINLKINEENSKTGEKCPICGGELILKYGKYGGNSSLVAIIQNVLLPKT